MENNGILDGLYAHIDQKDTNKKQTLYAHLINTALESKKIGEKIGIGKITFLVGLLHDIGKMGKEFQKKIFENTDCHVDHSTLGGLFIYKIFQEIIKNATNEKEEFCEKIKLSKNKTYFLELYDYTNIIMYSIMSHHGQFDMVRKGKDNGYVYTSLVRMDKLVKTQDLNVDESYEKVLCFFKEKHIHLKELYKEGFVEYIEKIEKLKNLGKFTSDEGEAMLFYKSMFIRLIVSILKSADIKDTINSYEEIILEKDKKEIEKVIDKFEDNINTKYDSFGKSVEKINILRSKISNNILKRSKEDNTGIYELNLPTGAGKTLLSLRYGINQMKYKNKERFFYITPFLSVLEQNAYEMKKVLEKDLKKILRDDSKKEEFILEYHSNIFTSEENSHTNDEKDDSLDEIRKKYLTDDFSSNVVLTTMVQFFNSIFKGKSSNIIRFKSLINSVIILDEWQSIPTEFLYITNLSLNFLKVIMNATIVLSTATAPTNDVNTLRHRLFYGDEKEKNTNIINLTSDEEKVFERVKLKPYGNPKGFHQVDDIRDLVIKNKDKSNLIILNTKLVVKKLYNLLKKEYSEEDLYYLTTNLTPNHRLRLIKEMKSRLKNNEKICVVSTQLIEAGVDVDFDMVIRSLIGMDSVVQAMGRCNREGKKEVGYTYLVNLDEKQEKISTLKGMLDKKMESRLILLDIDNKEIDLKRLTKKYFEKLYANLDNSKLEKTLELLGRNCDEREAFISSNRGNILNSSQGVFFGHGNYAILLNLFQSFKKAYDSFEMIDNNQKTAIVDYEETSESLDKIRGWEEEFLKNYNYEALKNIKKEIRKLSRHTVPVSNKDLFNCENIIDGTCYILPKQFYNDKFGVSFEETSLFSI